MLALPSTTSSSLALCLFALWLSAEAAAFNYEVEQRVFDRINDFMEAPKKVTSLMERFQKNGAFPDQLGVADTKAYSTLSYSMLDEYKFDMLYYGTEDGLFFG
jgi:hypothetical protein